MGVTRKIRTGIPSALVALLAVVCLGLNAGCSAPTDDPEGGAAGAGAIVTGNGGVTGGGTATEGIAGSLVGSGGTTNGGTSTVATGGSMASGSGGVVTAGGAGGFGTGGVAGSTGGNTGGAPAAGGSTGASGAAGLGGNGGAAGQGGAGGMAGSGYRPCPANGDACKILPLGDSITWGLQYDGAYRVELFSKAVGAGKKITFTGSQSNGPAMVAGQTFPKNNEGHSGWTITQVAGLVPSPALDTPPHIVFLHIGTNDIYAGSGQAMMGDRLGSLIDKIISAAPNALVVVAKIVPLSNANWNTTIKTYNDSIPGVVQKRADMGKHVLVVDLNTGFMSSMLSTDGVHPNKSGYDFMGDKWYATISDLLP